MCCSLCIEYSSSVEYDLGLEHSPWGEGRGPQDQEQFFPRMDQSRLGNDVLFFPKILLFKLGKRNWKEGNDAYKAS